jgi:hypothetical protein
MIRGDPDSAGEGQEHPNAGLVKTFYQAQAAFYAGGDDTESLAASSLTTSPGMCPGAARSPVTTAA